MPKFTDAEGREWDLSISLTDAKRVESADFSLVYPGDVSLLEPPKELFQAILSHVPLQFALIYVLVHPQAEELGVGEEAFCDAIDGTCLLPAKQALWEAITDFFPALKTSLARLFEVQKKNAEAIDRRLASVAEKLEQVSETEIDRAIAAVEAEIGSTLSRGSNPSLEAVTIR